MTTMITADDVPTGTRLAECAWIYLMMMPESERRRVALHYVLDDDTIRAAFSDALKTEGQTLAFQQLNPTPEDAPPEDAPPE